MMQRHDQISRIRELIDGRSWEDLSGLLSGWTPSGIAALLHELETSEQLMLLQAIGPDPAARVLLHLESAHRDRLLEALSDTELHAFFSAMSAAGRGELLGSLPTATAERIEALLDPGRTEAAGQEVDYSAGSVGERMSPRYPVVLSATTAGAARAALRALPEQALPESEREPEVIFVTDRAGRYQGLVPASRLAAAAPTTPIESLLEGTDLALLPSASLAEALRLQRERGVRTVPVVDEVGRLLGVVFLRGE